MRLHFDGDGRQTTLYTISDIAAALKMPTGTLWHRIYAGQTFPAPTSIVSKRAYYTEAEFLKLTGRKTIPEPA